MATITKRGDYQFQAIIRRKGFSSQTWTFETRKDAEKWARDVEPKVGQGLFRAYREVEQTTLSEALDRLRRSVVARRDRSQPA